MSEVGSHPKWPKPFSHVIPRRRTRTAEPVPRRVVYLRPIASLDPEALEEVARAHADSLDKARALMAWLKARNAIAASENAIQVKAEIEEKVRSQAQSAGLMLECLRRSLADLEARKSEDHRELARLVGPLGFRSLEDRHALEFGADEPVSLVVLAGRHALPAPRDSSKLARTGLKLLTTLGGGVVLGLSLGLLTGKLELDELGFQGISLALWALVGIAVLSMIGASLAPLAYWAGERLFQDEQRGARWPGSLLPAAVLTILLLAGSFVRIESTIEQLGIFRAITEQQSFRVVNLQPGDLWWVSLMLALPAVACYVVSGLFEGYHSGTGAKLLDLQEVERQRVREQETYGRACDLLQGLRMVEAQAADIRHTIERQESLIRDELTTEELCRIEDMEMDAIAAAWEAEDWLLSRQAESARPSKPAPMRRGIASSFRRILRN